MVLTPSQQATAMHEDFSLDIAIAVHPGRLQKLLQGLQSCIYLWDLLTCTQLSTRQAPPAVNTVVPLSPLHAGMHLHLGLHAPKHPARGCSSGVGRGIAQPAIWVQALPDWPWASAPGPVHQGEPNVNPTSLRTSICVDGCSQL